MVAFILVSEARYINEVRTTPSERVQQLCDIFTRFALPKQFTFPLERWLILWTKTVRLRDCMHSFYVSSQEVKALMRLWWYNRRCCTVVYYVGWVSWEKWAAVFCWRTSGIWTRFGYRFPYKMFAISVYSCYIFPLVSNEFLF